MKLKGTPAKRSAFALPSYLSMCFIDNVAHTIHFHFELSRAGGGIDEAIRYSREALELSPPGHLFLFDSLVDLAAAITAQFKHTVV